MIRLFTRRQTAPVQRNFLLPAHALTAGMSLWDGRNIEAVQTFLFTGEDRSAGRWCDACDQFGSHHTDRHNQFLLVEVTIEQVSQENASGDLTSQTKTFTGDEMVSLTDFPATRVRAANHALAALVHHP